MNTTELTQAAPEQEIQFGGVIWKKIDREDQHIQYQAISADGNELYIYQYPDGYSKGSWNSQCRFGFPEFKDIEFQFFDKHVSCLADCRETAMMNCLDAKSILISDITLMINALMPESQYFQGFRNGQEDIKAKIAEVVL